MRDPAQAEEVAQEAFLEVWRTATRFDPDRGSAVSWILTIAHRRAVDRVRSAEAASRRDVSYHEQNQQVAHDATAEAVQASFEAGAGARSAGGTHVGAARGAAAGVLRGIHTHGGGEHAGPTGRHRQDPYPGRADQAARRDGSGSSDTDRPPRADRRLRRRRARRPRARPLRAPPRRVRRVPGRGRQPPRGGRAAPETDRDQPPARCATGCSPTSPPCGRCRPRRPGHPFPRRRHRSGGAPSRTARFRPALARGRRGRGGAPRRPAPSSAAEAVRRHQPDAAAGLRATSRRCSRPRTPRSTCRSSPTAPKADPDPLQVARPGRARDQRHGARRRTASVRALARPREGGHGARRPDARGRDAAVLLEGDAATAIGAGITIEPEGGSEKPTRATSSRPDPSAGRGRADLVAPATGLRDAGWP